jgi:hypothetical protein
LIGAFHAVKSKGMPWDENFEPAAYLLSQRMPIHVIHYSTTGGTAWGCRKPDETGKMPCGINNVKPNPKSDNSDIDTWAEVGAITAAIPVRQKMKK